MTSDQYIDSGNASPDNQSTNMTTSYDQFQVSVVNFLKDLKEQIENNSQEIKKINESLNIKKRNFDTVFKRDQTIVAHMNNFEDETNKKFRMYQNNSSQDGEITKFIASQIAEMKVQVQKLQEQNNNDKKLDITDIKTQIKTELKEEIKNELKQDLLQSLKNDTVIIKSEDSKSGNDDHLIKAIDQRLELLLSCDPKINPKECIATKTYSKYYFKPEEDSAIPNLEKPVREISNDKMIPKIVENIIRPQITSVKNDSEYFAYNNMKQQLKEKVGDLPKKFEGFQKSMSKFEKEMKEQEEDLTELKAACKKFQESMNEELKKLKKSNSPNKNQHPLLVSKSQLAIKSTATGFSVYVSTKFTDATRRIESRIPK